MTVKTNKVGLVAKIMAVLGLDDAGKMQNFFDREAKKAKKEIKSIETNMKIDKMNYDNEVSSQKDFMDDAIQNYEEAKLAITPENVLNNSAMDSFAKEYWSNLSAKKALVTQFEKTLERLEVNFKEDVDLNNKVIAKYQDRIDIINE